MNAQALSLTTIGTIAMIIAAVFFSIGFIAVPVNNVQRIEYRCVCGRKVAADPFHTYSDCIDCDHRTWWPRLYATNTCDY